MYRAGGEHRRARGGFVFAVNGMKQLFLACRPCPNGQERLGKELEASGAFAKCPLSWTGIVEGRLSGQVGGRCQGIALVC